MIPPSISKSQNHQIKKSSVVSYSGWQNCLRLANSEIELIATTDVGPRIIRFGFVGGKNEFVEYEEQLGRNFGSQYKSYGGHRLWIAPEIEGITNHPDNLPVDWKEKNGWLILDSQIEKKPKIQKQIRLRISPTENRVDLVHRITNKGSKSRTLAPWALSVMAPGGRAVFPQEPFQPHSRRVLPVRPLVLWSYTRMTDARYVWGDNFVEIKQDSTSTSLQKIGARITKGWAAYINGDRVFLKKFPLKKNATYPDFGCNAEFFTNAKMLEVESLGPLVTLKRGEWTEHRESWFLFRTVAPRSASTAEILSPLLLGKMKV
jgi:hypothetical protein